MLYATAVSLPPAVTYTITVGAGGAATPGPSGGNGGNSSISGSGFTTVTAIGGGGGGGGVQNVYIQTTEPTIATGEKALWIDTTGGNLNFWVVTGD